MTTQDAREAILRVLRGRMNRGTSGRLIAEYGETPETIADALLAAIPTPAQVVGGLADQIERQRDEFDAEDKAEGCESRYCRGWLDGQTHAARVIRAALGGRDA